MAPIGLLPCPQCGMIMMLSKYFLKANLSRIWTPYSFRGKFISTSNAIPGRRLLLDCFCATCQSIIEEDIQRGCYQHGGTLQLTINMWQVKISTWWQVKKWKSAKGCRKRTPPSQLRGVAWTWSAQTKSSPRFCITESSWASKLGIEIIWAQCQINKDTSILWMWYFNHLLSPVPSKLLTAVLIVMKSIIVSPKDLM